MFFFNKYKIKKNKSLFNPEKQNLFIVIRKSPGEYDFIAYILNELKKKFNIFFIFNNSKSYKLLKNNKFLFNNFEKISFGYMINPKYRYFYLKLILILFKKLKIANFIKEINLTKKIYNLEALNFEIQNKFNFKNRKILFENNTLFCSYENKSGWREEFKNKHKIIYFPEKSNLIYRNKQNKKRQISKKNILALFPNKEFYHEYINKIEFKKHLFCGFPKYNKNWVNLFLKKNNKLYKYKVTVFFKTFESEIAYDKKAYLHQLKSTISILKKNKLSINFNLHPLAKEGFENYFSKKELKTFKISKNNIAQDIAESNLLIFKYGTNSILDCVAFEKYPIELWSLKYKEYFKISPYQERKLTLKCNNPMDLERIIIKLLDKKKFPTIDKQRRKFFLSDGKTKEIIKKIINFIEF